MKTPTHRRGPRHLFAASLLLLVLLLTTACTADDDSAGSSDSADVEQVENEGTSGAASADGQEFELGADQDAAPEVAQDDAAPAEAPAPDGEGTAEVDTSDPAQLPVDTTDTAVTGERIIKEGTVTIQVQPGDFDEAFAQVIVRAQELGGHVAGSSSSTDPSPVGEDDEDAPALVSGQVTIRVPVRAFEDLLTAIGDAGEIIDRNVTSQDVTAEFTDLESRRRHLQAQERFYLGLLEEAASVADAIAVQQQLDGIQGQIEQITGRLTLLEDRTSFSTLTVRIREQGADAIQQLDEEEPTGLTPYLNDAVDVFIATIGSIIVVTTFLVPFAILLMLAVVVWRMVRSGRQRQATAALPAPLPAPPGEDPAREKAAVGGPAAGGGRTPEGPFKP